MRWVIYMNFSLKNIIKRIRGKESVYEEFEPDETILGLGAAEAWNTTMMGIASKPLFETGDKETQKILKIKEIQLAKERDNVFGSLPYYISPISTHSFTPIQTKDIPEWI